MSQFDALIRPRFGDSSQIRLLNCVVGAYLFGAMSPILTLLLAFLIAFAPVAPGEAGIGHGMQTLQGEEPREDGHAHGVWLGGQAARATLSADCASVVGHCVTEMAPPAGDVLSAHFTVEPDLTAHPDQVGQGIVLTAEPPPPRA